MKLRKLFATAAMALCVALGASAQVSKEDVRIYINPGHGSWGPNNRHMATIGHSPISSEAPDTTDFFESNTNLRKALELLERLHQYGVPFDKTKNQENSNPNRIGAALDLSQNLVMSHVKCGPFPYETVNGVSPDSGNDFSRTLSTIAAEVESNDFDLFISIHSNANVDGDNINYLYFIYRTNRGAPEDVCVGVSQKCWDHRILDRHTKWSHYDNLVGGGSVKIATGNYAVLSHSVPGYLVEGYFHTYQPARHRYMNFDMCRLEGIDYARGVADYYGWAKENTGDICGVVRDKHQKFSDALYTPKGGTNDIYKPLNGVVVTLKKDGNAVATDTTDVNYNGLFAFRNLEPGDYTVEFSHPDYKENMVCATEKATEEATESLAVTVKAAVTTYPTAFLESVNYVAPKVVYVNYPDSTAGKAGYVLRTKYNMYDDGTCTGLASLLEGKTVRRTILRNQKLYILALDASNNGVVYIYDTAKDALVKTLTATTAVGEILPLSDIALTAEGVLVGINKCNQAYNGTNEVTAYKWAVGEDKLPEGDAQIWWTNNFGGNFNNAYAGESMVYDGTLENGKFIYTGTTTASNGNTRLVIVSIADGAYLGYMRNNQDGNYIATSYLGETFNMTLSPNADDKIIFDSEKVLPFEIQLSPTDAAVPTILGHMAEGTVNA
ncbi:MAG: SdrD B-like domain-containing protein, partial [Muribaculaceae bacterium]|nr:SdrD B-like domain-containing protein [Muribaculaceae bacterium]